MQLQPNLVFDEHYTLIRLLGVGGFSEVWLAHDSYMDLDVALKIYAPGQGIDEHSITDLRQEIRVVFQLNHTNLLKPSYLGVWNRMPYLVMPYCQQGSIISQVGKLSEKQIWKIIHDVASGLQYLHKNDIVHQDIKPDNILLDNTGNYVITDFGISTKTRTTLRKSVGNVSISAGTMAYMGPERFSKEPTPIKASDIWSFGAMMFELIEGNVPFGEMGGGLQKSGAEIPDITANVSDTLKQTIEQMLAPNTWDRPTADKLVKIAESFLNKGDISPSVPIGGRTTKRRIPQPTSARPDKLNFDSIGGYERKQQINVSGDEEWKTIVSEKYSKWLHVIESKDKGLISVWVDKNIKGKVREGNIYINHGNNKTISVKVSQQSGSVVNKLILIIGIIIGGITIGCLINLLESKSLPFDMENPNNAELGCGNECAVEDLTIDYERVKRLIKQVSVESSKGGNYDALQYCFAQTISPHPSNQTRHNYDIPYKTRDFVEQYDEYQISQPYDFNFDNSYFPLTVKCKIDVTIRKSIEKTKVIVQKTYYVNSDYQITGFVDNEISREKLNYTYETKTDIYYGIKFDVTKMLPVYSNENCTGQPSFYLYSDNEFKVLESKTSFVSARRLKITNVIGQGFPDCIDNGYKVGDELVVLSRYGEGYYLVLNKMREELACFFVRGNKAELAYDGCNMIEGNLSGHEISSVTMKIQVIENNPRIGYVQMKYDDSKNISTWDYITTY